MEKRKLLRVAKDGNGGWFGGYGQGGTIVFAHDAMTARAFQMRENWYDENEINRAKEYLEKHGWHYDEMIIEYQIYKA